MLASSSNFPNKTAPGEVNTRLGDRSSLHSLVQPGAVFFLSLVLINCHNNDDALPHFPLALGRIRYGSPLEKCGFCRHSSQGSSGNSDVSQVGKKGDNNDGLARKKPQALTRKNERKISTELPFEFQNIPWDSQRSTRVPFHNFGIREKFE